MKGFMEMKNRTGILHNEHDEAISMACKKFDEIHSNNDEPKWLKYCMSLNIVKNERKNWVVKFLIFPKPILEYNQYWDWQDDGMPLLIQVDPKTNKESIVICGGEPIPPLVLFEAEIDINNNHVIVLKDTKLNELDGSKYEINRQ